MAGETTETPAVEVAANAATVVAEAKQEAPVEQPAAQPQAQEPEEKQEPAKPEGEKPEGEEGEKKEELAKPEEKQEPRYVTKEETEELLKKQQEDFDRRQREREEAAQVEKIPDPLDMEALNAKLAGLKREIEEAELAGDMITALDKEDELRQWRDDIKKYNEYRDGLLQKKEQAEKQEAFIKQIDTRLNDAAKEIQEARKIPDDVVEKGRKWFTEQREKDPVLNKMFQEKILKQGEYTAMTWAFDYCLEHMSAEAKADQQQKNDAKKQIPSVQGQSADIVVGGKTIKTWDELIALPGKEVNRFCQEHNAEFKRLKDAHFRRLQNQKL